MAGELPFIPLSEPEIGGNEWEYVSQCLDSGWVSSAGVFVDRFENAFARAVGVDYAVATVNGTAALHVALRLAGVALDDEVVVSSLSFVAPANAIRYLGAWPVFIDAEPSHWQMDPCKLQDFLENCCEATRLGLRNRLTGRRIAAILPVHILGHPVDMDAVLSLAARWDLPVVEDATESLAATWNARAVGTLGHIGCFSFNGNKLITTGGGGMIVTSDQTTAERAKYLTTQAKDDPVEFIHNEVGYNYRMPNVLAAMGVAQLERLPEFAERKRRIFARYREALAALPGIKCPEESSRAQSVWWLSTIRIDAEEFGMDSRSVMRALQGQQIQTRPLWHPLHSLPPYRGCYAHPHPVNITPTLHAEALSLPCSTGLKESDQERVIAALHSFWNPREQAGAAIA
jgi:perosamine synthetase